MSAELESQFELLTFKEAAALFPSAKLTASSLKTEYENGNLAAVKLAGKLFVTKEALMDMIKGKTICHGIQKGMTSSSMGQIHAMAPKEKKASKNMFGMSSGMNGAGSGNVQQALAISKKLKNL